MKFEQREAILKSSRVRHQVSLVKQVMDLKETKDRESIKRVMVSKRDKLLRNCNKNERHYGQDCTEIGNDK